jgi:hypothetical protein
VTYLFVPRWLVAAAPDDAKVSVVAPVGRPRPAGYMISDQGILNVALGCTD